MKNKTGFIALALLALPIIVGTNSCEKLQKLVFSAFAYDLAEIPITINEAGSPPVFQSTTIPDTVRKYSNLNVDSIVKARAGAVFSLLDLQKVYVENAELVISNPDQANNLSNFESAFLMFNTYNSTRREWNQPVTFASINSIPEGYTTTLKIPIRSDINLLDYVKGTTSVFYAYGARARRPISKPINCSLKLRMKFE